MTTAPALTAPSLLQIVRAHRLVETERLDAFLKTVPQETIDAPDPSRSWYLPKIEYVYDQDLHDYVRYRNVVTGIEGIAYTGPPTVTGTGAQPVAPRLDAVRADAMRTGSNIVTLPILPRLPTSGTLFRGRPL